MDTEKSANMERLVVFISGHLWRSKRRAGFHHLAEAFQRRGWRVVFMTVALSALSKLRKDYRLCQSPRRERNKLIWESDSFGFFVWYTPWHPANFRNAAANAAFSPLVRAYARLPLGDVEPSIRAADLLIYESTPGIVLFDRFKSMNARAKTIYRVSDSLRLLGVHPELLRVEQRIAPSFDLISVPSPLLATIFPITSRVECHRHGLERKYFDQEYGSPYKDARGRPQAVSVGTMLFDPSFFLIAAAECPDVDFHVIGDIKPFSSLSNLFFYGEVPFRQTIPYIKAADVGVAPYANSDKSDYLADSSLKLLQYSYCRLPIVVPAFAAVGREHAFGYEPGNPASIHHALCGALRLERTTIRADDVQTWSEVVESMLGAMRDFG